MAHSPEGEEEFEVDAVEQVEATDASTPVFGRMGYFIDIFEACFGMIDGGDKSQLAFIGGLQ